MVSIYEINSSDIIYSQVDYLKVEIPGKDYLKEISYF